MQKGCFEVVGNVINNESIRAHAIINLGDDLGALAFSVGCTFCLTLSQTYP